VAPPRTQPLDACGSPTWRLDALAWTLVRERRVQSPLPGPRVVFHAYRDVHLLRISGINRILLRRFHGEDGERLRGWRRERLPSVLLAVRGQTHARPAVKDDDHRTVAPL
jgi:hypothetical protein